MHRAEINFVSSYPSGMPIHQISTSKFYFCARYGGEKKHQKVICLKNSLTDFNEQNVCFKDNSGWFLKNVKLFTQK